MKILENSNFLAEGSKSEEGQESLHNVYSLKSGADNSIAYVFAGIDGGGKGTRITITTEEELQVMESPDFLESCKYIIPSISSTIVSGDHSVRAKSDMLYDNMDSVIFNTSNGTNPIFERVHLVRGSLQSNLELGTNKLKTSVDKTDDLTYFMNTIDIMGYSSLMKFETAVPKKIIVRSLGISLPPEEDTEFNRKKIKEALKSFRWEHRPSGVVIDFEVHLFAFQTEPIANARAFFAINGIPMPEIGLYTEIGSRSGGTAVSIGSQFLSSADRTVNQSSTQLISSLKNILKDTMPEIKNPQDSVLEEALRTGIFRRGNFRKVIVKEVFDAKKAFAKTFVQEVQEKVFDRQSRVRLDEVNEVVVSGGTTKNTVFVIDPDDEDLKGFDSYTFDGKDHGIQTLGSRVIAFSVADFIHQELRKLSEFISIRHFTKNYIPEGLYLEAVSHYHSTYQDEDMVAVSEAAESVENVVEHDTDILLS